MPRRRRRSALAPIALLVALTAMACSDSTSSSAPPTEVIATAESQSRGVRIGAAFSTTPEADDQGRAAPIVLDGHVFGSGPTGVILAHQRPLDQTSWFPFATKLAQTGEFTVLTFDFRGVGDSTGQKEPDRLDTDLFAAYSYMRDQLGMTKIFLVGASIGGTAALTLAARMPVAGVVSISAPAQYLVLDALAAVPDVTAPKLFLASDGDVPAKRSEEDLWNAAADPKDRELYDGNAHGTEIFAGPNGPALERRLLAFLSDN